ncbi:MAG TPA: hypothetical protein VJ123_07420 [Anaerolineales bacterium]|nr:hypothetical protein [Anaerolineales bacterium]
MYLSSLVAIGALGWLGLRFESALPAAEIPPPNAATSGEEVVGEGPVGALQQPTATETALPTFSPAPSRFGSLIFAARAGLYSHLMSYVPGSAAAVQLTFGAWDDRDPAVSPDGSRIAFRSRRDGNWDLYLLDIGSGGVRRLTETPGFEGSPAWSPDGVWLAYEAHDGDDLNIMLLSLNPDRTPIQLTNYPANDHSPSWDPNGRIIAFISDRDGADDVFLADLDRADGRFRNLTNSPDVESSPTFDPSGLHLAYSVSADGLDYVMVQDLANLGLKPVRLGQGRAPAWAADGQAVAAEIRTAHGSVLISYSLVSSNVPPLGIAVPADVYGMDWASGSVAALARPAAEQTLDAMTIPRQMATSALGRLSLVELAGVTAPHPMISDAADEPFVALRDRVLADTGWDFLSSLENAFVGLNDPLPPGFAYNDWLLTGRAFAFSQAPLEAGWVEVVREDLAGETYWRVFVRAFAQDGSHGEPLRQRPWEFRTRFTGDPSAYDAGGTLKEVIPSGYFVDFTALAAAYGFDRLPALPGWRTYFLGARFNEFALTDELDWTSAMLEIYPPSSIVTPTPFRTPTPTPTLTPTPTRTPWWWRWRTPTASPTRSPTSTPTPSPSATP